LRRAERIGKKSARAATLLLLSLRLTPGVVSAAVVAALCVPSFVSLESERGSEAASFMFLCAAALGALVCGLSIARSVRAAVRARQCIPNFTARFAGQTEAVHVREGGEPFLGLAGAWRPKVVMSRSVATALDTDQLAAALRHEQAHRVSKDNLKRLLLLLSPDGLPGIALFRDLDRSWARFSEWAADDHAVAQDPHSSLALAEALVRVARLGARSTPIPLVSSFLRAGDDIPNRVERLLNPTLQNGSYRSYATGVVGVLFLVPFATALLAPQSLRAVHLLLERLMH
jgi:hypothetical protein